MSALFGSNGYKFYTRKAADQYRNMLKKAEKQMDENPVAFDHVKHIDECIDFIRKNGPADQFEEFNE